MNPSSLSSEPEQDNPNLDIMDEADEIKGGQQDRMSEHEKDEVEIDDGLGLFVKRKTLYHGSGTKGISLFQTAEGTTIGEGVYTTSEINDAIGYARRRSRISDNPTPLVYECCIENIKLCDLRKDENVKAIMEDFLPILKAERKKLTLPWFKYATLDEAIETIEKNSIYNGNIRVVAFSHSFLFTDFIQSLGYEGLISFEGGEGEDVGSHDSWVIFDPEKIKINQVHAIL